MNRRWINKYLRPGHQPRTLTGGQWPFDCLRAKRDWKRICCWCGHDLPKGRRNWCSQACVDDYQMKHDWGKIRAAVLRRDRGVCRLCGFDTEKLRRILMHVRRDTRNEVVTALGVGCGVWRDWWEADHIQPRADGGGNELTNLRTLCVPCHRDVTRKFAAERAARRRAAKGAG